MIWKDYSKLKGTHAFCGASRKGWENWDIEKLIISKENSYAQQIGTLLHEYAEKNIRAHFRINKSDKRSILRYLYVEKGIPMNVIDIERLFPNLMNYINDSIGYRMDPEVVLFYSPNFYGTADAISWNNDTNELKISDLKTGTSPAGFEQLEKYAAFFCLDYKIKPKDIKHMEFRIYQNNEILYAEPEPCEVLTELIDKIIFFNKELIAFEGSK